MSYYGGFNNYGGGGGRGRFQRPQNDNIRFGILPLMRPQNMVSPHRGARGGGPPYRNYRPPCQGRGVGGYNNRFKTPGRGEVVRLGPSQTRKTMDQKANQQPSIKTEPDQEQSASKDVDKSEPEVKQENDIKPEIKEETKPEIEQTRVQLDRYNSELHVKFSENNTVGEVMKGDGFQYMWGGVRATHGVKRGKVCFEVHILEGEKVDLPDEMNPCVARVGWSVDGSDYQLGEDKLSWGYGGTGKSSVESKFREYGKPFGVGDVVTCYVDLENPTPKAIFYALNGEYLGVAFRFTNELGKRALYPHVTVKNRKFRVNFGEEPPKFPLSNDFTMIGNLPKEELITPPPGPQTPSEAEVIVMVGLPGSGKSFWCEQYIKQHVDKKYYILGTNIIIDRMKVTKLLRKRNYHGRWEELIKRASGVLNKLFAVAKNNPRNYILDQTNVYFTARRRKMESFKRYKKRAVVIVNKPHVLDERVQKQRKVEGKIIPDCAIMEMKRNFTLPEVGPSFDEVMYVEEQQTPAREIVEAYRKEGEEFKSKRGDQDIKNESQPVEKRPKLESPSNKSSNPPSSQGPSRREDMRNRHHENRRDDHHDDGRERSDGRHPRDDIRRDRDARDGRSSFRRDERGDRGRDSIGRREEPPKSHFDDRIDRRPSSRDPPQNRYADEPIRQGGREPFGARNDRPPPRGETIENPGRFGDRRGDGPLNEGRNQDSFAGPRDEPFPRYLDDDVRQPRPLDVYPERRPLNDRPRDFPEKYPPQRDDYPPPRNAPYPDGYDRRRPFDDYRERPPLGRRDGPPPRDEFLPRDRPLPRDGLRDELLPREGLSRQGDPRPGAFPLRDGPPPRPGLPPPRDGPRDRMPPRNGPPPREVFQPKDGLPPRDSFPPRRVGPPLRDDFPPPRDRNIPPSDRQDERYRDDDRRYNDPVRRDDLREPIRGDDYFDRSLPYDRDERRYDDRGRDEVERVRYQDDLQRRDEYRRGGSPKPLMGERYERPERPYNDYPKEGPGYHAPREEFDRRDRRMEAFPPSRPRDEPPFDRIDRAPYRDDDRHYQQPGNRRDEQPSNYRGDVPYTGPDRKYDQTAPRSYPDNTKLSNSGDSSEGFNRNRGGSYQTQMTTSTANYGQLNTLSSGQMRGNVPSRDGQRPRDSVPNPRDVPAYERDVPPYQRDNPSYAREAPPRDRQTLSRDGPSRDDSRYGGSDRQPPAQPAGSDDRDPSYEKQQEDYQKAYSQWYANYAQAFAQFSQDQK